MFLHYYVSLHYVAANSILICILFKKSLITNIKSVLK